MASAKEDQELMNRLRSKYGSSSTDVTSPQDAVRDTDSFTGPDSFVHVHLCPMCRGSGIREEVYEYRRLQMNLAYKAPTTASFYSERNSTIDKSTCSHCQGEGFFSSTSATGQIKDSSISGRPCSTNDSRKAASEQHTNQPSDTVMSDSGKQAAADSARPVTKTHAAVQRKLKKLQQMLAELKQEEEELRAAIQKQPENTNQEQKQLQQVLLVQLQRRICQLQELHQQKQAMLV